jgi:hypothetical protein
LHYFTLCSEIPINYSIYMYYHLSHKTRLSFKLYYEPVWLRGRGCVSLKTHWANVWLRKKNYLLCMGLTINYVRNAGRWKAEKCCFLTRLSIQPWYTVQWTIYHASTVQWTGEAYSTVHWTVEHVNIANCSVHVKFFFFFF